MVSDVPVYSMHILSLQGYIAYTKGGQYATLTPHKAGPFESSHGHM